MVKKSKSVKIEIGSGNVYEDLGFEMPAEEQLKAILASEIITVLQRRGWTQEKAAKKLGLTQPKVSLLTRGQLKNFSVEKLMVILIHLNRDIDIVIKRHSGKNTRGHIYVYPQENASRV